ncbi:hypothetical protein E2C06_12640 [Dankookia rubra]|uniref:Uncharacterized protein n=1 Tax=Dankookia rubra TaxID=1442381 RepID=A0A4R5QHV8_9PROT|nr:hypothetical protein [Dankookia rubra]TDH62231.1 hypothetical protein E2C06_12640 [Dankookia rubra]
MFRSILLASTLAVALTGTAFAQGGPRVVGGGRDAEVVYDAPSDNVVGGGYGRITGEAGNRSIAYGGAPQAQAPTGLIAEITGEAGNRHVTYHAPGTANGGQLAGTPARRVGG